MISLQEPEPTSYDVSFSLLGFPTRVHPMFWLVCVLLGASSRSLGELLIWVGAVFVSILVHELGHAVTMRYFGESARIALYWGGGLAISGGQQVWGRQKSERGTWVQVLISFAGPLAGFLLAGMVIGIQILLQTGIDRANWNLTDNQLFLANQIIAKMLFINIFWGLINLLPVYPLDGGQISRALFLEYLPSDGLRISLWLSVISGGGAAIFGLVNQEFFLVVMFGFMAYSSYQMIQRMDSGGFGGGQW